MELDKIKRLAAQILKSGENKVWINPEEAEKAKEAMTKEDVRALIKEGIIKKRKDNAQSRGRARKLSEKKSKGRKKGKGKRKGTKKARVEKKKAWMGKVRAQRKTLKKYKKELDTSVYRKAYSRITGGFFRGKKHVESFIGKGEEKK